MGLLFKNNAETTLSGGINDSVTTVPVTSAAVFPTPDANNVFFATIDDGTNVETVKVTGISSNDLTVVREQDNTSAAAFSSGAKIELRLNAKVLDMGTGSITDLDADTKIQVEESSDEDTIRMDIAGTEVLTLTNSAMTLKGTTPTLTIGDAGAEDTKIVFDGNAQDYYIGLDDSADDLIIGKGSTVGTTPAVVIDENLNVGIGSTPTAPFHVFSTTNDIGILENTSAGTTGAQLLLYHNSSSPADNDRVGALAFLGKDDGDNQLTYGGIRCLATDVSNGSEDGALTFSTTRAGSFTEAMRIDSTGKVGIGTTAPAGPLHVDGHTSSVASIFEANGNGDTVPVQLKVKANNGTTSTQGLYGNAGSASGDNTICLGNSGSSGLTVNNSGNVSISGSLSKGSGSFKIDHPLEAKKDTHYLIHSFVEGPQADNIYRGKVDLTNGTATINIDTVAGMTEGTFVALNTDVQCFTSNESSWDAVKGSISGNVLTIESQNSESTATVSWMVIGERQDQHMIDTSWTDENGKVIIEPLKPIEE